MSQDSEILEILDKISFKNLLIGETYKEWKINLASEIWTLYLNQNKMGDQWTNENVKNLIEGSVFKNKDEITKEYSNVTSTEL